MSDGSPGFSITVENDPDGVLVRIVGEIDLATAPEVNRVCEELVGNGHGRLLLDLDGVEFMDSTGLSAIAGAKQAADSNGHRLAIRCGSPQVRRLFELTGMLDYLDFE